MEIKMFSLCTRKDLNSRETLNIKEEMRHKLGVSHQDLAVCASLVCHVSLSSSFQLQLSPSSGWAQCGEPDQLKAFSEALIKEATLVPYPCLGMDLAKWDYGWSWCLPGVKVVASGGPPLLPGLWFHPKAAAPEMSCVLSANIVWLSSLMTSAISPCK